MTYMRFCLIDWRKVVILDVNISDYYSYELFDANGNRLDYVVRADTETGEIERYIF